MGLSDAFVLKLEADGVEQWTAQLGTSNYEFVTGVTVDAEGNVIFSSDTTGTMPGYEKVGGRPDNLDGFVINLRPCWRRATTRGTRGEHTGNTAGMSGATPTHRVAGYPSVESRCV